MGLLVDGTWHDQWYDTEKTGGRFERSASLFRNWISADGAPGPTGEGGFPAAAGRYVLVVSLACPWAHRTLIMRKLKGLEAFIPVLVVHPHMGAHGWTFDADFDGSTGDTLYRQQYLYQWYLKVSADYSGHVTVPLLWDIQQQRPVNNESAEIIRMFNSAFDDMGANAGDYYPQALRAEVDVWNARIYPNVNNGVYRAGFATTQQAYDEAVTELFAELDVLEARLRENDFLCGAVLTEADIRLFTTLMRFDAVYFGHFKCNLKRIADYPALSRYAKRLYQLPGIAQTVRLDHIQQHYYWSHTSINPYRIVPKGRPLPWHEAND